MSSHKGGKKQITTLTTTLLLGEGANIANALIRVSNASQSEQVFFAISDDQSSASGLIKQHLDA